MRAATESQRAEAQVRLAEAYTRLNRPEDAAKAASGLAKTDGPTGRAGAFRLAEAKLKEPTASPEAVVLALETAFGGGQPAELRKLIPAADAKRVCTAAFTKAKDAGDFPLALRLVKAYAAVAGRVITRCSRPKHKPPGPRFPARRGEALVIAAADAWGRRRRRRTRSMPATPPPGRRPADESGRPGEALALLGEWAARLATYPRPSRGRVDGPRRRLPRGRGPRQASRHSRRGRPARTERPGPARLAGLLIETDAASREFAEGHRRGAGRRRPATQEAIYSLGSALLLQRQWPLAEARLRSALQAYPASPRAARGRYQFAQVFRQRASVEARKIEAGRDEIAKFDAERLRVRNANLFVPEQARIEDRITQAKKTYDEMLQAAYDEFRKAEELLLAAKEPDATVVKRTMFWAADCAYWVGVYEDSARRYEKLAARYQGKAEELEALAGLHRTCTEAATDQREKDPVRRLAAEAEWGKRAREVYQKVNQRLDVIPSRNLDGPRT